MTKLYKLNGCSTCTLGEQNKKSRNDPCHVVICSFRNSTYSMLLNNSLFKHVGKKQDIHIQEIETELINLYHTHKLTKIGFNIRHEIAKILISVKCSWHWAWQIIGHDIKITDDKNKSAHIWLYPRESFLHSKSISTMKTKPTVWENVFVKYNK